MQQSTTPSNHSSASQILLSICIVNWNGKADLRRCLAAIVSHPPLKCGDNSQEVGIEALVVDNASTDGSSEMVRTTFPQVRLMEMTRNVGFGRAANKGIEVSAGQFILVMNPDVMLQGTAINTLVEFMQGHPRSGSCGPKLLNPDGSLQLSCRRFPTLATGFFRSTFLGRLLRSNPASSSYLMEDYDHKNPLAVDWLSGACLLLRREAVKEIGGFDEDFFMFCEDVDLAYRLKAAGWENWYVPEAEAFHRIGSSTSRVPARMTIEWHKSMYRFYSKHYAATYNPFMRALAVFGIFLRCGAALLKVARDNFLGSISRHVSKDQTEK